ncbi:MAG: hypothetical protein FJ100_09630 [Deltaproteobacteria bacterium]|nr:hypothetical protein [Deltaproteobacteria bacterium]
MRRALALAVAAVVLGSAPAVAESLAPRETARILAPGQWQVGLFNPLRYGLQWVEIELHPIVFLAAPHIDVKVPLSSAHPDQWQWTAHLGLGVPTLGWRLPKPMGLAGDLVPSCKVAEADPKAAGWCQRPGWLVVPKFGVWATREYGHDAAGGGYSALSLRAEIASGFAVSGDEAAPLDAWGPVDVQLAPQVGRTRAQVRAAVDHRLLDGLRARAEIGGYWVSRPAGDDAVSPWTLSVYAGLDVRATAHTRVTLGAMVYDLDRRQQLLKKTADGFDSYSYVRSHELWPTVDVLWTY